jgi:O-antigen/teichoic acid export membrane protein
LKSNNALSSATKNTYGILFYWFTQWLTTIIVFRVLGATVSGVYTVAISYVSVFYPIMNFGITSLMLSDSEKQYCGWLSAFGTSSVLSVIIFSVGLIFVRFDTVTILCCVALMLYKLAETLFQYFYAIMLKNGDYTSVAVSHTLKGVFSLAAFCGTLLVGGSIFIAILSMFAAYVLTIFLFDMRKFFKGFDSNISFKDIFNILKSSFPIMLTGLYLPLIHFVTRYTVQRIFSEDVSGSFATLSMLLTATNMIFAAIWTTFTVKMSSQYELKDYVSIKRHMLKICLGCLAFALIVTPLCWVLRNDAVNLIFGAAMLPYADLFVPFLLAGGLLGVASYFATVLLAARKRKYMLYSGFFGAIICTICVMPFANLWGLIGAVYAVGLGGIGQIVISEIFALRVLKQKRS